jgi:hypothetical protein
MKKQKMKKLAAGLPIADDDVFKINHCCKKIIRGEMSKRLLSLKAF